LWHEYERVEKTLAVGAPRRAEKQLNNGLE